MVGAKLTECGNKKTALKGFQILLRTRVQGRQMNVKNRGPMSYSKFAFEFRKKQKCFSPRYADLSLICKTLHSYEKKHTKEFEVRRPEPVHN